MVMNLEELCSWLSHQKGMMAQTYAKDLAKYIVRTKPLKDEEIIKLTPWDKNPYESYTEMELEDLIRFAKKIEERHGIK